jgi:hypothetical protein
VLKSLAPSSQTVDNPQLAKLALLAGKMIVLILNFMYLQTYIFLFEHLTNLIVIFLGLNTKFDLLEI